MTDPVTDPAQDPVAPAPRRRKAKPRAGSPPAPASAPAPVSAPVSAGPAVIPPQIDPGLPERARGYWQAGDWPRLAGLDDGALPLQPDRARLALLAAVGQAQEGRIARARDLVGQARAWGCDADLIARVMLGSTANSLGRAAVLAGDAPRGEDWFRQAVAWVSPRADAGALGRGRAVQEHIRLGLLPEAARMMTADLAQLAPLTPTERAEVGMLREQIALINSQIARVIQARGTPATGADRAPENRPDITPAQAAGLSASQLGQDLWVLEQTGFRRDGYFVEFGATDGVLFSNSLLLERHFGWTGICAEPNPAFFAKLCANRHCITVPDCVLGQTGRTVEFVLADEYGGVRDFIDQDNQMDRRTGFLETGRTLQVTTLSLHDLLVRYDAPQRIDYISIDTEGSELDILQHFPFERWDVRLFTIEHNFSPQRDAICALLTAQGYVRTERQWDDWYAKAP